MTDFWVPLLTRSCRRPMHHRWFAKALLADPGLSRFERLYVRLFGVPVQGWRIRARALMPWIFNIAEHPRSGSFRLGIPQRGVLQSGASRAALPDHRARGQFAITKRSRDASPLGAGSEFRRDIEENAILKILDAGTGRGLFALALASLFPKASVTGIDLDEGRMPRNRAMASNLGLSNCDFQVRDVTTLSPGEDWDFILSTDNLEHLDDDAGQCRVFFGALKPGGRLLVHVPHLTRNLFGFKRENFMGIEGHVRPGYTQAGLRRLIEDAGFRVLREAYTYGWWETLANDLSYLITGGREKRKMLYAMCFPLLMLISQLGRWCTPRSGSGLLLLAEKAADQGSGGQ